jgi:uncharacterized protein YndB with AHSA1/START domain
MMTSSNGSRDAVVLQRTVDAPIELVWQMWTDPDHFRAWYGPAGAAVPVAEMDVRVVGRRRLCMEVQGPSGPMRMWFTGEYLEVVAPRRLVYSESMSDEDGNVVAAAQLGVPDGHPASTEVRVELEEVGGRTKMVVTHVGIPAGSPGAVGWEMALDALAAQLAVRTAR